jgi:hypothetical protein
MPACIQQHPELMRTAQCYVSKASKCLPKEIPFSIFSTKESLYSKTMTQPPSHYHSKQTMHQPPIASPTSASDDDVSSLQCQHNSLPPGVFVRYTGHFVRPFLEKALSQYTAALSSTHTNMQETDALLWAGSTSFVEVASTKEGGRLRRRPNAL